MELLKIKSGDPIYTVMPQDKNLQDLVTIFQDPDTSLLRSSEVVAEEIFEFLDKDGGFYLDVDNAQKEADELNGDGGEWYVLRFHLSDVSY
jgi:hypothetical protein